MSEMEAIPIGQTTQIAERNWAPVAAGVAIGAVAVGAVLLVPPIYHRIAGGGADPGDSEINVTQIDLTPTTLDCAVKSPYDVTGANGRTPGYKIPYLGQDEKFRRGAKVAEGVSVSRICVPSEAVTIQDDKQGGRPVKIVSVKVDDVRFDTKMSDDKVIVPYNSESTDTLDALSKLAGIGGNKACKVLGVDDDKCATVKKLIDWNGDKQAVMNSGFEYKVNRAVQEACGPIMWKGNSGAFAKSYKLRAKQQGVDENDVIFQWVDENNQPTTKQPDFSRSLDEDLERKGIIRLNDIGAQNLKVSKITCTPQGPR